MSDLEQLVSLLETNIKHAKRVTEVTGADYNVRLSVENATSILFHLNKLSRKKKKTTKDSNA